MNPVWLDRAGGLMSATCALHCLLMVLLPAALPMLGLGFLSGELTEWGFTLAAVAFALVAAGLGYRAHRSLRIGAGFGAGIALLLAGRFGEELGAHELGTVLAVIGGVGLVVTHIVSLRTQQTRASAACH